MRLRALAIAIVGAFVPSASSFLAPIGAVLAQTAGTAGPVSLGDLFTTPDSVELRGGAEQKLREAAGRALDPRSGCAEKAKFKVTVKRGDPLFQAALAHARKDVIKSLLADDLMTMSGRTEFSAEVGSTDDVEVDYDRMQDRVQPKLHTSSVPPKGSKVKPGDQIEVTMVARDDATRSETGIQRIQLVAQHPGGDGLVGARDYPPVVRTDCAGRPQPRTLVLAYTVPSSPPPIVRLKAIAEDFADRHDTDIGEFPTGDWYGTFGWKHACQGGGNTDQTRGAGDLTLVHDGRGNLTGMLAGSTPERTQHVPPCTFTYLAPATFSAKLVGSYTPGRDTFSAQAIDIRSTPGRASWACPAGGSPVDQSFYEVYGTPMFQQAFRDLRRQPDGSWRLIPEGTDTHTAAGGSCTTTYSLTLHQARN